MNQIVVVFLALVFMLSGCSDKNSNPKDYWDINEPIVHTWDTHKQAEITKSVKLISDFKSSDIKNTLGYESFIEFPNLAPEIKFEIKSSCQELESENLESEDESQISKLRQFQKTSNLERSNIVFLYNFLPDEVLVDDIFSPTAPKFNCNFKITAKNQINSEKIYDFNNIPINTFNKNFVDIKSIANQEDSTVRSINVDPNLAITSLPSLYYTDDSNQIFTIVPFSEDYKLLAPGYIKCIDNDKFNLIDINNEILTSDLDDVFESGANHKSTTFLKKCRIVSMTDAVTSTPERNNSSTSPQNNRRLVWSDYFNVIFEQPKIQISVRLKEEVRHDAYPFNRGTYMDQSVVAFEIEFKNNSNSLLRMRLPSAQKIEATLTPLVYYMQMPGFKPVKAYKTWGGLRTYQLNEEFNSELKFMFNGQRIAEFDLEKNTSKVIAVVVDKNFNCNLPAISEKESNSEYRNAERGFRIRAIPLDSEEDKITIDYLNQGQLESYPESFSFNRLFESADTNLESIRNVNLNGVRSETNYMQVNTNRTTVIDAIVLRSVLDINAPPAPAPVDIFNNNVPSMMRSPEDSTKRNEINRARKYDAYPNELRIKEDATSYCQQVY